MKKLALFGLLSLASAADGDDANVRYLMGDFKPSFGTQDTSKWCIPADSAKFEKGTDGKIALKVAKWTGPCTFLTTPESGGLVGSGKIIADADPIIFKNIKTFEEPVTNAAGDIKGVRIVRVNTDPKDTITRTNTDKTAGTEKVEFTLTFTYQADETVIEGKSYTYVATFTREGPIQCLSNDLTDADKNCVEKCPDGTFGDGATKKCGATCPAGQFGNKDTNLCNKCSDSCATCDKLNSCLTCNPGKFLPVSGNALCDEKCVKGTYGDDKIWKCVNAGDCGNGRYPNDDTLLCTKCNDACATCTSDTVCQSCNGENYLPAKEGVCAAKCAEGTFGNPADHKCIADCGANRYGNTTTTICTKCNDACETCTGDIICTKCKAGNYLPISKHGALCAATCADGSYKGDPDLVCKECSTNCQKCTGAEDCTTCNAHFGHPEGKKTCTECGAHEFSDNNNACKACDTNQVQKNNVCGACDPHHVVEGNTCTKCAGDQIADPKTQKCKTCDPGTITKSDETCDPCKTGQISENNKCETCKAGHISESNKCKACDTKQFSENNQCKTCKTNQFVEANACKDCPDGCTECENGDKCTKCADTHEKDGEKCKKKSSSKLPYIIVGVIALIVIAGAVFYWFYRKRQADNLRASLVYKSANSYNE